jgi:Undecaprenyl-phosphate galactose phosphotransferase WbaP
MNQEQVRTKYKLTYQGKTYQAGAINRRVFMSISLALVDTLSLLLSFTLAVVLRFPVMHKPVPAHYVEFMYLLPIGLLIYIVSGLYNHNLNAVEELRRLTQSTSVYYLGVAGIFFLAQQGIAFSRLVVLLAWGFSVVSVPVMREAIRALGIRMNIWGEPVVVFGNGRLGNEVVRFLSEHPQMGFIPVAIVDRRKVERATPTHQNIIHDQVLMDACETLPECLVGIRTAFVVVPETSQHIHSRLVDDQTIQFERMILVTSAEMTSTVWVQPLDIGGILGLEVGHNLLNRSQQFTKRAIDLLAILVSLPFTALLFLVLSILIKLDSRGNVFYHQMRIGYNGKPFKMWKFRSMHRGADEMLCEYLKEHPEAQQEWDETHKLKNDPRITRVGKFLRKSSLDEFPQLINVFLGEMGLVGPRPIVSAEIIHYDRRFELYKHVIPGMTGMWQISGRSDTTYEQRVTLDEYYVRNWSIWLDAHILIRTFLVVLRGRGSY